MLRTDGLTRHVADERLGSVLLLANGAGGTDNVTVILARFSA